MGRSVEEKTNAKKGLLQETSEVNRDLILSWLNEDIQTLRRWAKQSHTIKNSIRIQCLRASIYGCSIMLQTLKDKELDELVSEVKGIKERVGLKT